MTTHWLPLITSLSSRLGFKILQQGYKTLHNSSWERGLRISERNSSSDIKISEEGGGGGSPDTGAEVPLQPVVRTMVKQVVPLQSTNVHSGVDTHPAACGGPHAGAGGCAPKGDAVHGGPTQD